MKFILLSLFVAGACAQLSMPGGSVDQKEVQRMEDLTAELRKNLEAALGNCCKVANGNGDHQAITDSAKAASENSQEMQKTDKLPRTNTCDQNIQGALTKLNLELKPFGDLTGPMPDPLWKPLCSEDAKNYKEGQRWTSEGSKGPTTKVAFKCLETIEASLKSLEKNEQCKPDLF